MNKELATWTEGRPGPFSGRTPDSVWNAAWRNFNEGPVGRLDSQLTFMVDLQRAGFGIRHLVIGGCALDQVT